jgi:FkbM family methyltransferase
VSARIDRLRRLTASDEFRTAPVRAVAGRVRWRLHWRLFPTRPLMIGLPGGLRLRLAHTSASSGAFLNGGLSDAGVATMFLDHLLPGMVAIDGGAHVGEYTLLFAAAVGAGGRVHAFEPDPRLFPVLAANVARNRLIQVNLNEAALGDAEERRELVMAADATASSLAGAAGTSLTGGSGGRTGVRVRTLDAYAEEHGLTRLDAIKLDVEGAEAAALAGAERCLSGFRPGLVFAECDDHANVGPVGDTLTRHGYTVSVNHEPGHSHPHVIGRRS